MTPEVINKTYLKMMEDELEKMYMWGFGMLKHFLFGQFQL